MKSNPKYVVFQNWLYTNSESCKKPIAVSNSLDAVDKFITERNAIMVDIDDIVEDITRRIDMATNLNEIKALVLEADAAITRLGDGKIPCTTLTDYRMFSGYSYEEVFDLKNVSK